MVLVLTGKPGAPGLVAGKTLSEFVVQPTADRLSIRQKELRQRAERVLGGGGTRVTVFVEPHPPYLRRGAGYEVEDTDGRVLIDAQNNYTALIHGHAHPDLVTAATAAVRDGASFGLPTPGEIDLAEHLTGRISALDRVRFTNSGTEAVMMAIRTARGFTGRAKVLRFAGCYHGTYDSVIGGRGASPGMDEETLVVPYDDTDAFAATMKQHGSELACILLDLLPNRAGLRSPSERFVAAVAAETRGAGALLVIDEVITGRLAVGGLHQTYGLAPDLVVLGKMIGGGFPVGAFGGRADLMDAFAPQDADPIVHGGTFTANPVTMSAGLAALRLLDAAAIARLNALGDELRARLARSGYSVTGRGSLARIHPERPMPAQWWSLYEAGVLIGSNGLIALSTPMTEATVVELAARFGREL